MTNLLNSGACILVAAAVAMGATSSGTLRNTSQPLLWSGSVGPEDAGTAGVPECMTRECERFDLFVNLPGGAWNNKPGGIEVAIRWVSRTLGDNLFLYIYRNGVLVAKSDGIISTAQSVLLPPGEGLYTIYVARDPASPNASVPYDGLAEVEYEPNVRPLRKLLPDIVPLLQRNLGFDPGGIFFDDISATYPSCYASEVAEENGKLCLRFDQIFANIGEGPMELRFAVPKDPASMARNAFQRIRRSDGTYTDRLAGEWEYHPVHDHYHFKSFGLSRLWKLDAKGKIVGKDPVRTKKFKHGTTAVLTRSGKKVSFCMADIEIDLWGRKGNGPRTYNAPDCLFFSESDALNNYLVQGITQGWADVYDWYLPDQYIDVYGVTDGTYLLETLGDPDGLLEEVTRSNNCTTGIIRLSAMLSGAPKAEMLGPGPACSALPQ